MLELPVNCLIISRRDASLCEGFSNWLCTGKFAKIITEVSRYFDNNYGIASIWSFARNCDFYSSSRFDLLFSYFFFHFPELGRHIFNCNPYLTLLTIHFLSPPILQLRWIENVEKSQNYGDKAIRVHSTDSSRVNASLPLDSLSLKRAYFTRRLKFLYSQRRDTYFLFDSYPARACTSPRRRRSVQRRPMLLFLSFPTRFPQCSSTSILSRVIFYPWISAEGICK